MYIHILCSYYILYAYFNFDTITSLSLPRVRQIRAEKSESCAILHRSMKLCKVIEGDLKINFRSGATAKFIYFWP